MVNLSKASAQRQGHNTTKKGGGYYSSKTR